MAITQGSNFITDLSPLPPHPSLLLLPLLHLLHFIPAPPAAIRPSHVPSPLSPQHLTLAISSARNTPPTSRTGSCSPLRPQLKRHYIKKPSRITSPKVSPTPKLLSRSTVLLCHAKYFIYALLPYLLPQLQFKIHESRNLIVVACRTVSGTVSLCKTQGGKKGREGRAL